MIPALDTVRDPGYLAEIGKIETPDLRKMRGHCGDLENGLSYVRRLAQGRLDLLEAATEQRDAGGGSAADLVAKLPEVLSEGVRASGSGRIEHDLDPPEEVIEPLVEKLDETVGPNVIASAAELDHTELSAARLALQSFEDQLSGARRDLHLTIDSLNDELARRLADGEDDDG